jgi:hypothetical protein
VPLPVPLLPDVIAIHAALLVAVHPQPLPFVTFTLPVPPPAVKFWLVGLIVGVQTGGAGLLRMMPPAPTAYPVPEVVKNTLSKLLATPLASCDHVLPPFVVFRMRPPSPTTHPLFKSLK